MFFLKKAYEYAIDFQYKFTEKQGRDIKKVSLL